MTTRFYDTATLFPFLKAFSEHFEVLQNELKGVLAEAWMEWPESYLYEGDEAWDVFAFRGFGRVLEANCRRCPETDRLLQSIPNLKTALYSRLGAGTAIKPHRGPGHLSNYILRSHFGLIVPTDCGVWVEGEEQIQQPGTWITFDDTHLHSGFNRSSADRIVLIIDIDRPPGVPKGTLPEAAPKDAKGLPDNWGVPEDFLKFNRD